MEDDQKRQAEFSAFAALAAAFGGNQNNAIMPTADADDIAKGAQHIPGEVTDARRTGETVNFIQSGTQDQWYWEFQNGNRIVHG